MLRLLAVFLFGFVLGGLVVSIQRRQRLQIIKNRFEQELEALVAKHVCQLAKAEQQKGGAEVLQVSGGAGAHHSEPNRSTFDR
jgi:hypothetical protein